MKSLLYLKSSGWLPIRGLPAPLGETVSSRPSGCVAGLRAGKGSKTSSLPGAVGPHCLPQGASVPVMEGSDWARKPPGTNYGERGKE